MMCKFMDNRQWLALHMVLYVETLLVSSMEQDMESIVKQGTLEAFMVLVGGINGKTVKCIF